jgi:hypothetical protein
VTSSITLQRCANGVICIPGTTGAPPDLSTAYIFGDIKSSDSAGTAALLAFINGTLGGAATVGEVRTELQAASAELAPEPETPLP